MQTLFSKNNSMTPNPETPFLSDVKPVKKHSINLKTLYKNSYLTTMLVA